MSQPTPAPPAWIPVDVRLTPPPAAVTWLPIGAEPFSERLFDETVARCRAGGVLPARVTDLEALRAAAVEDGPEPTGFIFHMSRCGSSALASCLRALRSSVVIAEPLPVNQFLFAPERCFADGARHLLLRGLIRAMGRRPPPADPGNKGRYFVKFTSWNVLWSGLIREAFPGVPGLFVYRDPVEVMVANLRRPGGWMRRRDAPAVAAALAGVPVDEAVRLSPEEYGVRVLARLCSAALAPASAPFHFLDYRELGPAALPGVLQHFGVTPTAMELAAMAEALRVDAKDPERKRRFEPDSQAKQAQASPGLRALAEEWLADLVERMARDSPASRSAFGPGE
jgi:hypothetical protein